MKPFLSTILFMPKSFWIFNHLWRQLGSQHLLSYQLDFSTAIFDLVFGDSLFCNINIFSLLWHLTFNNKACSEV